MYLGTTPKDYEELTPDQLYLMTEDKEKLKIEGGGTVSLTVGEAKAQGIVNDLPPNHPFADLPPGASLTQRLRANNKAAAEEEKQMAARSTVKSRRDERNAARQARAERRRKRGGKS